jgi:hypothetical protein
MDVQRHRAYRMTFGRHPPAVCDQKLMPGPRVDHCPVKHPAKRAEQVIPKRRGRPLNRVHAEGHWRRDRPHDLPPGEERLRHEETVEDDDRRRRDRQALLEWYGSSV